MTNLLKDAKLHGRKHGQSLNQNRSYFNAQFPSDPYEGQVFYDPYSDTTYEFWIPRKDDEFCKKLKIKPKWIVKSFESECVSNLFSKNGKNRYLHITNL